MDVREGKLGLSTSVFAVVLTYAFLASVWILLSDRAMAVMVGDAEMLVWVSMAKGWFFVAMTSVLLYFLVRRLVDQLTAAHLHQLEPSASASSRPHAGGHRQQLHRCDLCQGRGGALPADQHGGASRFIGKPLEDVLGHDDRTIFPPEQAALIMKPSISGCAKPGSPKPTRRRCLPSKAQGSSSPPRGRCRTPRARSSVPFGISRDITERKVG